MYLAQLQQQAHGESNTQTCEVPNFPQDSQPDQHTTDQSEQSMVKKLTNQKTVLGVNHTLCIAVFI